MISKHTAITLIIGLIIFAALVWWADHMRENECPRQILGYNCRGKECDHSFLEVEAAKDAMRR